ncbi:GlcG/HbpS family heme-binding protein [Halopelagius fulvigenes]|uniref:Heme-binding protein n=1 Tax=Halopelagius fulvigenes TaxID=1198324 RepID=A0ABD5TWP7_9EURY
MVESISLEIAKDLIQAAEKKAEEIDNPMVITVANSEGNLVAQHRMDGAWLASVSISRNKAYTAAALETPTHELAEPSEPGNSLYGLQTTDDGKIVIFGGGYPLERDGEIVGTIGVSGGAVSQDREVAEAGVERWLDVVESKSISADD